MTWTMHRFKQTEIAAFQAREDLPPAMREFLVTNGGVPVMSWITREFLVNDDGVWIEPWGSHGAGWITVFFYWHGDVRTKLEARRASEGWVDYDPSNKTEANFALGPRCRVWIDDRHHPLSDDQQEAVKAHVTEFLINGFKQSQLALPPYPETVVYL